MRNKNNKKREKKEQDIKLITYSLQSIRCYVTCVYVCIKSKMHHFTKAYMLKSNLCSMRLIFDLNLKIH